MGPRGEAVVGKGLGTKLQQFADIVYRFWLHKRSKFDNFFTIYHLILDQYVLLWGLSDIGGGLCWVDCISVIEYETDVVILCTGSRQEQSQVSAGVKVRVKVAVKVTWV